MTPITLGRRSDSTIQVPSQVLVLQDTQKSPIVRPRAELLPGHTIRSMAS